MSPRPYVVVLFVLDLLAPYSLHAATSEPLPAPKYAELPIGEFGDADSAVGSDGTISWISMRPISNTSERPCWPWELVRRQWSPATGTHDETALGLGGDVHSETAVDGNLFALTSTGCQAGKRTRLIFVNRDGKVLSSETDISGVDYRNHMLPFGKNGAIVFGNDANTHFPTVVTMRVIDGTLSVKRHAPLELPYKRDFALVALTDGRLLLVGGSNDDYKGCMACKADTWILDPATDRWSPGPKLLEARSVPDATLLPDGSVLVTGGWTAKAPWGYGPSATTELWRAASDHFEPGPTMPSGNSDHHGMWWPGAEGKTLLLVDGTSSAIQAFDVATRSWFVAGALPRGSEEAGCGFYPFKYEGTQYAWVMMRSEGFYSSKSCGTNDAAQLMVLRSYDRPTASRIAPPESLLRTHGTEPAFLPAEGAEPAILAGGTASVGMNSYLPTRAVDAIDRDGRIYAWPSLGVPRQHAKAFRVAGGVLVIGGNRGLMERLKGNPDKSPLPSEWRQASGTAPWQIVADLSFEESAAVGQLANGNLLSVDPLGNVEELSFAVTHGQLLVNRTAWPLLNETRLSTAERPVSLRELRDGRVVVAGGQIQTARIARQTDHSNEPNAPDEYVGYGPMIDATNYEIYDPASKSWHVSAEAARRGMRTVVLADGTVLRELNWADGPDSAPEWHWTLDQSSADGTRWHALSGAELPDVRADLSRRLYTIGDDLYVFGLEPESATHGDPSQIVQRWDAAGRRWVDVWREPKPYELNRAGRVLIRTLNGSPVVLPVGIF